MEPVKKGLCELDLSMRVSKLIFLLAILVLAACSPEPVTLEVTRIITQVAEVEVTTVVEVTRLVELTRIVELVVTETSTPTLENAPTTNTPTPTPSPAPTETPDLPQVTTVETTESLTSPKGSGIFTVGVDILPGKWHSTGLGTDCYWARLDANQELLDNHFGLAGGTVNIKETDYEVEFENCGTWEYVDNADQILRADATEPKSDGFYTVNVEIAPGRWRSTGSSDACYWVRLDENQVVLENHFGLSGGTLFVPETDYEVAFEDCGTWRYLGP